MKKWSQLFLSCYICFAPLFGAIHEVHHFHEIKKHVDMDTLVILDIDDTLLLPQQTLGTDVWYRHRLNENKKRGLCPQAAFEKTLNEWEAVRRLTKVKIVEEGTDHIVKEMQDQGIRVMGLSTQGFSLAQVTASQLNDLNIFLDKNPPSKEDHYFSIGEGVLYRKGILFTSGAPKGKALFALLDKIGYRPQHIVFINDKETHIVDVEGDAHEKEVKFTGLRYAYCDKRIEAFNPEIAEIQFAPLKELLSDDEAHSILKSKTNTQEL